MYYITLNKNNYSVWKQKLITCYKEVFAAPPWNENWWTDELVAEIVDDYIGNNAKIVLAIDADQVIGFSWGSILTGAELSLEVELPIPIDNQVIVGYIKDIGVTQKFRKHGIGNSLFKELINTFRESPEKPTQVFARTLVKPKPSVVYLWFPELGFTQKCQYSKNSERAGQVILGCELALIHL